MAHLDRSAKEDVDTAVAYLMLDGPGEPHVQLMLCVFLPVFAVLASWALLKLDKRLVWASVILAVLSATIVLSDVSHGLTRFAMIEEFGGWDVLAIFLAALFPFVAIAHFHATGQMKVPNQAPEPMRAKGPHGSP